MKAQRAAMAMEEKQTLDEYIRNRLHQLILEKDYQVIHTFLPMDTEIDLFPLLQQLLEESRTLVCPQALPKRIMKNWSLQSLDRLAKGVYGTRYPADSQEYKEHYDLIILPGLAFDKDGYRVGYGAGYYDALLSRHREAYKIGIAYPFQLMEKVPKEAHDERLDEVIIGNRSYKTRNKG